MKIHPARAKVASVAFVCSRFALITLTCAAAACEPSAKAVDPVVIPIAPAQSGQGLARPAGKEIPPTGSSDDALIDNDAMLSGSDADIGAKAPGFLLDTVPGPGKTGLRKGQVTLVHFWATWCEPCKKSFHDLEQLYLAKKSEGVVVVGISVDDEGSDVPAFATTHGATFPIVWDPTRLVTTRYKPTSLPSTFVIDRNGVVRFVHRGYHDDESTVVAKEVAQLL